MRFKLDTDVIYCIIARTDDIRHNQLKKDDILLNKAILLKKSLEMPAQLCYHQLCNCNHIEGFPLLHRKD